MCREDDPIPCDNAVGQRQVRGVSSAVFRALLGLFVGAGTGALVSRVAGWPSREGVLLGGALGLAIWGLIGVFIWATFPYKSAAGDGESDAGQ
jgi:hypothetical protein